MGQGVPTVPALPLARIHPRAWIMGVGPLQSLSYLAVELLQERDAALGTLLVVAHHPKLLGRETLEASRNLLHAQLLVALDGKAGGAQTLLA